MLDTRKTTPTLRALEKYAVRVGGGTNHRFGLYDLILIKDNHVRLAGGVAPAIAKARAAAPGLPVEIEAQTVAEAAEAADAGADIILLDNLTTAGDSRRRGASSPGARRPRSPAASHWNALPSWRRPAPTSSRSARSTHSVHAADISFEIEPVAAP